LEADLAAHADWSVDPRKRWVTIARRRGSDWTVTAPRPVGDVSTFLARLIGDAENRPVALGADLPLGLPRAYAATRLEADFPGFLRGVRALPGFFSVCSTLEDIGPGRPFYPARGIAGMTRLSHALALGLADAAALCRACDRATAERPAGAPLFWTLGANQSGKAAIAAWQSMILPALESGGMLRLWPFEGPLLSLLSTGCVALAETYPAEALRHLNIRLRGSKRRQADRRGAAEGLLAAMDRLRAAPEAEMRLAVLDGFGGDSAGEDRFDSVLGLLCLLNVLAGNRPDSAPEDPWIQRWEGWVLGQTALPLVPISILTPALRPVARGAAPIPVVSSWPGLSGPPVVAGAGGGGPDKPGHDD
jgi:hypothetical protein